MPECDHCGAAFDDGDDLARHLRDEHGDELSRIDRRRVERLEEGTAGLPAGRLLAGAGVVLLLAGIVYVGVLSGGGDGAPDDSLASEPLPERGDETLLSDVEHEPAESTEHIPAGTEIDYRTVPPTSGPHYDGTVGAGFYEETPPLGELVHSLEHGAVVIYYDPAAITPEAEAHLRAWANEHAGTWSSVIVVPHPRDDPEAAYVLTAWEYRLELTEYDESTVRAFIAEYLGRGPENPVR